MALAADVPFVGRQEACLSEKILGLRGSTLALIAAGIAVAAIVVNVVHSGKMLWGGVLILLLSLGVWRGRGRKVNDAFYDASAVKPPDRS